MDSESQKRPTTAIAPKKRPRAMRYSVEDDIMLLRQVLAENPYEDCGRWKVILQTLLQEMGSKPFSLKNMRERVNLLLDQFQTKDTLEILTSGVEPPPMSEKDQLLEQIKMLKSSFTRIKKTAPANVGRSTRDAAAMQHWSGISAETVPANALQFDTIEDCEGELNIAEVEICQGAITPQQVSLSASLEPAVAEKAPSELQLPQPTSLQQNNASSTRPPGLSHTPKNGGGPIRRTRAGINRSVVSYLNSKRELEAQLKLKTIELEFLKEQNESRRIALQEQQMALVTSCLNKTVEVLTVVVNRITDRSA